MLKKVIIGFLLTLIALIAGAFYVIPSYINPEVFARELKASFKTLTGLTLDIEGEVIIERFPVPHIQINSLYVHNAPGASTPNVLSIRLLKIWPSYKSLFTKQVTIQKIDIDGANIELERLKNGQMNWRELISTPQEQGETSKALTPEANIALLGTTINFTHGNVHYTNPVEGTSAACNEINLNFLNGGPQAESTLRLSTQFRDKALTVVGHIGNIAQALSAGEVPSELSINSNGTALNYKGNTGYKDGKLLLDGHIHIKTEDIVSWLITLMGPQDKTTATPGSNPKAFPFQLESDIASSDGKITFPNITLQGALVQGGGFIEISPTYALSIKSTITALDLASFLDSKFFAPKDLFASKDMDPFKSVKTPVGKEDSSIANTPSLLNALNLSTDLTIQDTLYNGQHLKDAHLTADMSNGEMVISQATATLPGNARIVFAGLGKESYDGFALEGEIDASGDDFGEMTKLLKTNGMAFPPEDFKRFRIKANAALSSKNLRLSEIAARIENIGILGGAIATFGERTKVEAALRIGGVNLDHFAALWQLSNWQSSFFGNDAANTDNDLAHWLRRLDYNAAMNISLEAPVLMGQPRDKATLKLTATSGQVLLDDIQTSFNGSNISGSLALDVNSALPKVNLTVVTDKFNPNTFFTPDGKPQPQAAANPTIPAAPVLPASDRPRWSQDKFDFHWMQLLNATFHFTAKQYEQDRIKAQSLDMRGEIENGTLTIDALTSNILGAQVSGKGNIKSGRIPSISVAANVTSLDPVQLLPFLPVLQSMTGKFNMNVKLDANGIDMNAWMSSLEGAVGINGTNVDINGFNLAGIIHSVSYVRTVADILNVVRRAFPGGDTLFSHVEGQWTITSGVLKTSNFKLISEYADGLLTSQIDLINWLMQSSINLSLKGLDPAHPPGMIISFSGSLDAPSTSIDTRSLEQYVTNKTSQQMLQGYGSH